MPGGAGPGRGCAPEPGGAAGEPVKGFCSPALRARPDRSLGRPWGEEGAGGGRSPGRWSRFKTGALLPPLSIPPAPGSGVPLRAGSRGSGPGGLREAQRAVRVRPRLPGGRGKRGWGELCSAVGSTRRGVPGLACTSAAGAGRISLLSQPRAELRPFRTPAGGKVELLPLNCMWIYVCPSSCPSTYLPTYVFFFLPSVCMHGSTRT